MNAKKTAIIAILFVVLGLIYMWDQNRINVKTTNEMSNSRLVLPERAKVTELNIKHKGIETKMAKAGEAWKMTAPVAWPVDKTVMDGVLTQLDNARKAGTFDVKPEELKNFGLENPAAVVDVRASGDNYAAKFEVGSKTTDGTAVYARLSESKSVFTIPVAVDSQVEQPPKYYRDKRLIPADATLATSFTLAYSGRRFDLAKNDTQWRILNPNPGTADSTKVGDLLHEISFARAQEFVDTPGGDLAKFGLNHASWLGSVYAPADGKDTSMTLMIGDVITSGTTNTRYAMQVGQPTVFQISPDLPVKLQATLNDLKDKALYSTAAADVGAAEIVAQGHKIALVRDAQAVWHFKDSPDKVDQSKANIKISSLAGLKAVKFIDDPSTEALPSLANPILQLTLSSKDGKTTETVFTGKKASDADYVYGRKFGNEEILAIDWKEPGNYILSHEDFVDKTLLSVTEDKVGKIEIDDNAKKMVFTPGATQWEMKPTGSADVYNVDKADVSALLAALNAAEWERQLRPSEPGDAAMIKTKDLDKPGRVIIVTDTEGKEVLRLAQPGGSAPPPAPGTPAPTPTPVAKPGTPIEKYLYVKVGDNQYYTIDKVRFGGVKEALDKLLSGGAIKKK